MKNLQDALEQPQTDNKSYKRLRIISDDSISTAESSPGSNSDDSFFNSPIANECETELEDLSNYSNSLQKAQEAELFTRPYLSNLNLATIIEEETECDTERSDRHKISTLYLKTELVKVDSDESPF